MGVESGARGPLIPLYLKLTIKQSKIGHTTTDVSKSISNFNFKRLATWLGSIFEFRRKMTEIRRKSSEIASICTYLSGLTMNEDKQLRYNYMCTSKQCLQYYELFGFQFDGFSPKTFFHRKQVVFFVKNRVAINTQGKSTCLAITDLTSNFCTCPSM